MVGVTPTSAGRRRGDNRPQFFWAFIKVRPGAKRNLPTLIHSSSRALQHCCFAESKFLFTWGDKRGTNLPDMNRLMLILIHLI
jgi:hypothetical protein